MKVSAVVFACYDKSCAPPPAGRGGSSKGGSRKRGGYSSEVKADRRVDSDRVRRPYSQDRFMRNLAKGAELQRQSDARADTAQLQTQKDVKMLAYKMGARFEDTNDKGAPLPNHGSVLRHPSGYTAHISRRRDNSIEVDAFMAPGANRHFADAAKVHKRVVDKLSEDGSTIKRGPNSENWDKHL